MAHEDLYPGFDLEDMRKLLACDIVHDLDIDIARVGAVAELHGNEWCGKGSEDRVLEEYKGRLKKYRRLRTKFFEYVPRTDQFPNSTFFTLDQTIERSKVRILRDTGSSIDEELGCKTKLTFGSILDQGSRASGIVEYKKASIKIDVSSLGFDKRVFGPVVIQGLTDNTARATAVYKGEMYDLAAGEKFYRENGLSTKVRGKLSGFLESNGFIKNEVGPRGKDIQLYAAGKALGDGLQVMSLLAKYGGGPYDILTTDDRLAVARAIAFDVSVIQLFKKSELRDQCVFIPSTRFVPAVKPKPAAALAPPAKPPAPPTARPPAATAPPVETIPPKSAPQEFKFSFPPIPTGVGSVPIPSTPEFHFDFPPIPGNPSDDTPSDIFDANLENEMEIVLLAQRIAKHYNDALDAFKSAIGRGLSEGYVRTCRAILLSFKSAILFQYDVLLTWFTERQGKAGVDQLKLYTDCRKILDHFRNSAVRLCPPNTKLYKTDGGLVDNFIICNASATDCMFSGFKIVPNGSVKIDHTNLIESLLDDDSSKIKNRVMWTSREDWKAKHQIDIGPQIIRRNPTQIRWASNSKNVGIVGSYFFNLSRDRGNLSKLITHTVSWFSGDEQPDEPDIAEPPTRRQRLEGSGRDDEDNEYIGFKMYVGKFGLDADVVIGDAQSASDMEVPDKGAIRVLLNYTVGIPSSNAATKASSVAAWNAYTSKLNAVHSDFSQLVAPWKPLYSDNVPNLLYELFRGQEMAYIKALKPDVKPVAKVPPMRMATKTRRNFLDEPEMVLGDAPPIAASRRRTRRRRGLRKKN